MYRATRYRIFHLNNEMLLYSEQIVQYNIRLMQKSPADTAATELQEYE